MLFLHNARFLLLTILDNFCFNGGKNAEPVLSIQSEIEEERYGGDELSERDCNV